MTDELFQDFGTESLDQIIDKPEELKTRLNVFLKLIHDNEEKIKENEKTAENLINDLIKRRDEINLKYRDRNEKLRAILEDYITIQYKNSKGKIKSEELLYGIIGLRKKPGKIVILDEKELLDELMNYMGNEATPPQYEKMEPIIKEITSTKIDKKELKKFIQSEPNISLKNAEIVSEEPSFYIKFGGNNESA